MEPLTPCIPNQEALEESAWIGENLPNTRSYQKLLGSDNLRQQNYPGQCTQQAHPVPEGRAPFRLLQPFTLFSLASLWLYALPSSTARSPCESPLSNSSRRCINSESCTSTRYADGLPCSVISIGYLDRCRSARIFVAWRLRFVTSSTFMGSP